jgi:hypothetical protein
MAEHASQSELFNGHDTLGEVAQVSNLLYRRLPVG